MLRVFRLWVFDHFVHNNNYYYINYNILSKYIMEIDYTDILCIYCNTKNDCE